MDRSLDEVISERKRQDHRRAGRRRHSTGPRDGVRKSTTRDDHRDFDRDWVHDRYDDGDDTRGPSRRGRDVTNRDRHTLARDDVPQSAKIRIENLHYELTEDDIDELFSRIGPVTATSIKYDRAGRSTGMAFVTYENESSARIAIREYDRANANGQPIYLTMMPSGPSSSGGPRSRNPFDTAQKPSRSLFERIEAPEKGSSTSGPRERFSRSVSPDRPRLSDVSKPAPEGIDRYIPGQRVRSPLRSNRSSGAGGGGGRSRPERRRLDGGAGGGRRDEQSPRNGRGGGAGGGSGGLSKDGRPRKTQEELDAEMEDYWGSMNNNPNTQDASSGGLASTEPLSNAAAPANGNTEGPVDEGGYQTGMVGEDGDVEMIG
ncbi:MAG: hypothetical protein M1823_005271 [Watsoniomyces obsoletus]|nr:MAG: hypothetical protein M1823_005271 [Watsoniomyces obsoletus]